MKLYSYIITHDSGFAPNPFWSFCTLACCKPIIRRMIGRRYNENEDYWIVGLSKKNLGNKIIYAMNVNERPLTFDEYYNNKRFKNKIPDQQKKEGIYRRGDNIYKLKNNEYKQIENSNHKQKDKRRDLSGEYVLISDRFFYFGEKMIQLPKSLEFLIVTRGYRTKFTNDQLEIFQKFIKKQQSGVIGCPSYKWSKDDHSWEQFKS